MSIIINENKFQILKKTCNKKEKKSLFKDSIIKYPTIKRKKPNKLKIIKCSTSTPKIILKNNQIDFEINGKLVDELFKLKNKSKI
jgi:CRISPR/Cas system CMR subunit Cmr6 (Cas7 group RAMP superfamily)